MKLKSLKNKTNLFLLGLIGLTILLRIPALFEPYWHGDEGIYFTVGQRIFSGDLLYGDVYDNKPPIIYLIFGAAKTIFTVRLISTVWVVATLILIFKFAHQIAQKLKLRPLLFAAISGIVFSILASTPVIEANTSNGELWFILPTTTGMYLLFLHLQKRLPDWELILIGLLFSIATLIKVPAITDFAAAGIMLLIFGKNVKQQKIRDVLLIGTGFVFPWIVTSIYFILNNSFSLFYKATFTDTSSYVDYQNRFLIPQGLLIIKGFLTLAVTGLFYIFSKRLGLAKSFIFIWLTFSLLGALIGGRNYTHYLIQALPAFSLAIGLLAAEVNLSLKTKIYNQVFYTLVVLIIFKLVVNWVDFPTYQIKNYYKNFIDYKLGNKDYISYIRWFDTRTERLETITSYLKSNTSNDEAIYVWGNEADIYHLSGRRPVGRYITAYHLFSVPGAKEYTLKQLENNPPNYIVQITNLDEKLIEMDTFIETRYQKIFEVDSAAILKIRFQK